MLVIDLVNAFTDPASPLGSDLDDVVATPGGVLDAAARQGLPIIFTTVAYDERQRAGRGGVHGQDPVAAHARGRHARRWRSTRGSAAQPTDTLLVKQFASSFFGTALSSLLVAEACDTLVICGATTSGCIRATAVDAIQHGFRAIVPRECVGDRAQAPHEANLFDIQQKYGDVVGVDDVLAALGAREAAGRA